MQGTGGWRLPPQGWGRLEGAVPAPKCAPEPCLGGRVERGAVRSLRSPEPQRGAWREGRGALGDGDTGGCRHLSAWVLAGVPASHTATCREACGHSQG